MFPIGACFMYWNPNPVAFTLPFINLPVYIYGISFVSGFILGYLILVRLMQKTFPEMSKEAIGRLVDKLTWFGVGGTIIGARLGHVLLYEWDRYAANPWLILNVREGGLASHGGTIGVIIALALFYHFFYKKTGHSFLNLLDHAVIPTALIAFFIRLGNFFNQEIVGTPSALPWAVLFAHPADHHLPVPRHPAQLYEGIAYLCIFGILLALWQKTKVEKWEGFMTGLFFVLVFGSRFLIEFVKEYQYSALLDQSFLQAGQLLSIPFILLGLFLMAHSLYRYANARA